MAEDSVQSLTIVASLLGTEDIVANVAKAKAALADLQAQVAKGGIGATGSLTAQVAGTDGAVVSLTQKLTQQAGPVSALANAHKDLASKVSAADTSLKSMASTLSNEIQTGVKRAAEGVGLLTAGIVALGVQTALTMQQTTLGIATLTGMTQQQAKGVTGQLFQLTNPYSLQAVSQAYEQYLTGGATPTAAMALTKGTANIAATLPDPASAFSGISTGLGRLVETGRLDTMTARTLVTSGLPLYPMLEQLMPGSTQASLARLINNSSGILPIQASQLLSMIENMTGVLAPRAGGLAAHRTTTTRGAFDEILKEIRGGSSGSGGLAGLLSGSLGGAGSSNSGGGLTSWLAGFTKQDAQGQTPIDKAIAGIAPQVTKALNDMGPAMTHLLTAAAPLIPTMVNLADAAPKVIDNLAPIVKGFSVTANVLSKVLDNKGAVDVLEGVAGALLLYKGLSTVISVIKGVYSTIHDAQTIFSADGLKGLLGKTVTTTTMEVAANVVNVIGGGVGAGGPGSLLNDVEAAGAGAGLGTLGFLGLAGAIAGGITVGGPELFGGKHNIQKKGILSGSGQDLVDFSNWVGSGLNDALSVFGLGTHKKPVAAAAGPGFAGASGTASGAVTINQTITVPGTANHATISAGVDKANRDAQDSYARARNNRG